MALAPVKQPVNWSQAEWQAAMQNPLGSTAIRLDARADAVANGLNVLIQIAADDLYYKRVNGAPVTDLEIGFGERNAKEWTRVRRDGATITIKENPQQAVKPSIVRFPKMWTIEPDTTAGALDRSRSHDRALRRAGHAAVGNSTVITVRLKADTTYRSGGTYVVLSGFSRTLLLGGCHAARLRRFRAARLRSRLSALAQAPPDQPNFRAGTTLVEFTVVVTGRRRQST